MFFVWYRVKAKLSLAGIHGIELEALSNCLDVGCILSMIVMLLDFMDVGMHRVHSDSCFRLLFEWIPITYKCWACCCSIQHDMNVLFVLWGCIPLRCIIWFLLIDFLCWREIEIRINLCIVKIIAYSLSKLHGWVQIWGVVCSTVKCLDNFLP